jgi:hypothetical protein
MVVSIMLLEVVHLHKIIGWEPLGNYLVERIFKTLGKLVLSKCMLMKGKDLDKVGWKEESCFQKLWRLSIHPCQLTLATTLPKMGTGLNL